MPLDAAVELNPSDYSTAGEAREILSDFWPLERDGAKLWETLLKKTEEFYAAADRRGLFQMCRLAYGLYYGVSGGGSGSFDTQCIKFAGDDGELLELEINELRSYWDQIFGLVTRNRPAFQAQALNTDAETLGQVESASTLVGSFYEQELGELREKEAVKSEGMYGKSFLYVDWDPDGGREVAVPEEHPTDFGPIEVDATEPAGEFVIQMREWWEVICEPTKSELTKHAWRLVVEPRVTKHEMCARYPLHAKRIMSSEDCVSNYRSQFPGFDIGQQEPEDMCSVHTFYYAKNPACPTGRRAKFVNDVLVEDEFDLPIGEIPLAPYISCELKGTCFGASDLWNIIPGEQLKHQIISDIATNIEAFGRPPLIVDDQADFSLESLANGQIVLPISRDAARPEALKYPQVPDVSFKVIELLKATTQSQTALNAVARGDTTSNVTSGAHAALYMQTALEAQNPRQAGLDLLRERVANLMLKYLQKFAKHPQIVAVVGLDEQSYLENVDATRLKGIQKIRMKTANPMMRTPEGRLRIAELLRQWEGLHLDVGQVIELITSGQLKPLYKMEHTTKLHIRRENEKLLQGPPVMQVPGDPDPMTGTPTMKNVVQGMEVLVTEDVREHVQGHFEVLYSPAAERNPAIKAACQAHILEHFNVARNGDPYAAQILGIPGPQQLMAPPAPAGGGSKPSPESVDDHAATAMTAPDDATNDRSAKLPTPATAPPVPAQQNF